MGDIGQMFSDKSDKFKNIRSTILLKKVLKQVKLKVTLLIILISILLPKLLKLKIIKSR